MKNRPSIRLLTFFLALLMLLGTLSACNGESDPGTQTDTENTSGTESETESKGTESNSESDDDTINSVLNGVQFKNEVIQVFSWTPGNLSEYVETVDENTTLIDQAVFNRCDKAESRLNLRINWTYVPKNNQFVDTADRENSNGGKYDILASVSTHMPVLMSRGTLSNLMRYQYLDFDHEAWPSTLLEDLEVGNKLYFASGDISPNLIFMTFVLFYNKALMKDLGVNEKLNQMYQVADIYELVESGKWTYDKLFELSEGLYLDVNNSGSKDLGDRFAYLTYEARFDDFFYGAGCTIVSADNDSYAISDSFQDAIYVGDVLEDANRFIHSTNDGHIGPEYTKVRDEFVAGRVLFSPAPASHAWNTYSNLEGLEYGALPNPKWSESQTAYSTAQSIQFTMYSVASQSKNSIASAALIQALAEEANAYTRPACFDKLMKGRYAEDPEDARMWEYAVDANVFDMARFFVKLYQENQGITPENLFRERMLNNNNNWSGVLDSYIVPLTIYTATLSGEIAALPD